MQESHTLSIAELFFIDAKRVWGVSSPGERVTEVRRVFKQLNKPHMHLKLLRGL